MNHRVQEAACTEFVLHLLSIGGSHCLDREVCSNSKGRLMIAISFCVTAVGTVRRTLLCVPAVANAEELLCVEDLLGL